MVFSTPQAQTEGPQTRMQMRRLPTSLTERKDTMQTKVSVGITSVIGWLVAAGGAVPILVKLLEEGQKGLTLAGPEKYAAITSVVALGITQFGRYFQAHAMVASEATPATPVLPPLPKTPPAA